MGWSSDRVDLLMAAARRSGMKTDVLEKAARKNRYNEPWLHTKEMEPFLRLYDLHNAEFGKMRLLSPLFPTPTDWDVADLLEE